MPERYRIEARLQPEDSTSYVDLASDFTLVKEREITVDEIVANPRSSPYCIDLATGAVAFAELPEDVDLARLPFFYQSQRTHARAVDVVSIDEFLRIGAALPPVGRSVCFIYSVGRCGSTLLHHILGSATGVVSLSEPDLYAQLIRYDGRGDKGALLDATTRILRRAFAADQRLLVIKLRAESGALWEIIDATLGAPPSVFLYRNAIDTVQSVDRAFTGGREHGRRQWLLRWPVVSSLTRAWIGRSADSRREQLRRFESVLNDCSPRDAIVEIGWAGVWLLTWLRRMQEYTQARARSPENVFALRYEDLMNDQKATVTSLFERLGLAVEEVDACCRAMGRDSQEGTFFARGAASHPLDQRTRSAIQKVLSLHSAVKDSAVILPGTLGH